MKKELWKKKWIWKCLAVIFWLLVWQIAAMVLRNKLLLPDPFHVIRRLVESLGKVHFYKAIGASLARIMAGFFLGMLLGVLFGGLSYYKKGFKELLSPLVTVMKAVPVAAVVVLVLIWVGSKNLAIPISFMVVFPQIYLSTMSGLEATDPQMLEMAQVYEMPKLNRVLFIYRPAAQPYIRNAAKVAIGMAFKSGIAAEVIGIPKISLGSDFYLSKIYLDTENVLCLTVVVLLLSYVCEKLFLLLYDWICRIPFRAVVGKRNSVGLDLQIPAIAKFYNGKRVVSKEAMMLEKKKCVAIMGASGSGKTTWLSILMGIVEADTADADTGEMTEKNTSARSIQNMGKLEGKIAPVFQEDRLCMEESAINNVRMVVEPEYAAYIAEELATILPEDCLRKPVKELSGGMRRKVAVARACLSGGNMILLDEPFTGLDHESKLGLAEFIRRNRGERSILFTSHYMEDLSLLKPDEEVLF